MIRLHALAHLIHEGEAYDWHERIPGDGSGVPHGKLTIEVEVESAAFWRALSRLIRERRALR